MTKWISPGRWTVDAFVCLWGVSLQRQAFWIEGIVVRNDVAVSLQLRVERACVVGLALDGVQQYTIEHENISSSPGASRKLRSLICSMHCMHVIHRNYIQCMLLHPQHAPSTHDIW